jgi:hypothetical protein
VARAQVHAFIRHHWIREASRQRYLDFCAFMEDELQQCAALCQPTRRLSPRCGTAAAFAFVRARARLRAAAVQRKWDRAHFCAMHRVVCVGAVPARPTARPRRYEAEMNNLSAAVHAQESNAHAPNAARTHSPSSTRHYLVSKRKALRCRLSRARGVGEHTCACAQVSNRAADEALNDTLSSQLQVRSPAAACVECQRNCARVSMGGAA